VAVIAVPEPDQLEAKPTVVLWEVETPGTVGTLIRSAAAFGWNVACYRGADPWSPKVLRAGAGAHFGLSIAELEDLAAVRRVGLSPMATVASGGRIPEVVEVSDPVALLVGNEAHGLPREVVEGADGVITIPMRGLDSLNAAVAGSIAMYVLSR
jgi:TrmH family RNA methyltransferase